MGHPVGRTSTLHINLLSLCMAIAQTAVGPINICANIGSLAIRGSTTADRWSTDVVAKNRKRTTQQLTVADEVRGKEK